ncbi:16S rRNA (uracil(1498)-N(3))-methyltransferase [Psychrobacillus lasiicapitis]|uniref:Ribosomal RNA small subunit methyltransferase E n=1 Tax=Psychrobacillus lasiicapitis TaxID=1636719 RepID=A0A544TA08_9BACI|nr:16S rRNA (uracil(1498)-N(3))-methyltransferase [Psychrobacillus lasiicapitis]TQR14294.1 16S rRNA (uracil(1498)-N(3))-methyltransferase [Psychrobacillus lasiicapitis]GGA32532.1 ribosomal RNA small subunit methyltransferase E [Psychrobacillus lasiicapitis]
MQRYFTNEPIEENNTVTITGEDAHHMIQVMRMSSGDDVYVVANNQTYTMTILEGTSKSVLLQIKEKHVQSTELPIKVSIVCGLPKGDKLELITQKATELGMHTLYPFEAKRSIVKWDKQKNEKKITRLQKIAKEAAEQSHRSFIPLIHKPISLAELLEISKSYDVKFVADEEDAKLEQRQKFADKLKKVYDKQSILIVFGPEGGLDRQEVQLLLENEFQPIALGPRILRTETAPLYALAAISYEYE